MIEELGWALEVRKWREGGELEPGADSPGTMVRLWMQILQLLNRFWIIN